MLRVFDEADSMLRSVLISLSQKSIHGTGVPFCASSSSMLLSSFDPYDSPDLVSCRRVDTLLPLLAIQESNIQRLQCAQLDDSTKL